MTSLLVSIDIGGTLGYATGPSLAATLTKASPLDPHEARQTIRQTLYTQPTIEPDVIANVCEQLRIPERAFPLVTTPSPLRLVPDAPAALQLMSQHATLVTLSNVTCLDAGTDQVRDLLHPWIFDHFPSCRIGHAKPDPAAFQYVATACRASTTHMVHIGDDWTCDVMGARAAGVAVIWVSNGRPVPEPERLTDPGVIVAADLAAASRQLTKYAARRKA